MLRLYNTATRKVEEFKPINPNKVGMYVCGLTVYNDMHLGHARTYISFDVIRRWLEYSGYEVTFVQNHTDIDDKIIQKANEEGVKAEEIASRYIERTMEDLEKLQVRPPTFMPKATDFIKEMIGIVSDLVDKNHAYVVEPVAGALSPDVYFDISSASEMFGTLTGQKIEDMEAGSRVAVDSRKRHPSDFVLWKGAKPDEPSWKSPWGLGRPGWHIECSAMSLCHLGKHFDIHGGGVDLKFPHHESEILQTECHTEHSPVANYWIHTGFLTIDKEKMSKSLGNYVGVDDTPGVMFNKLVSMPDSLMWRYFELLSLKDNAAIEDLRQRIERGDNPRDIKMELARELIARYHGDEAAANAHRSAGNQLAEGELPEDLPEVEVVFEGSDQAPIAAVLNRSGLANNSAQAKDMLGNGRVRVDGEVVAKDLMLALGQSYVIQAGKKRYARVTLRG